MTPGNRKYIVARQYPNPPLRKRIIEDAQKIVRALGYDMNSIEFAIKDGVPYAIDFMNPAPDLDIYSLQPFYFDWALKCLADVTIQMAKNPRPQIRDFRWSQFF